MASPKPGAPVSAPVRGKPPAQAPRDEGGRFATRDANGAPLSLEARFRQLEEQRRR